MDLTQFVPFHGWTIETGLFWGFTILSSLGYINILNEESPVTKITISYFDTILTVLASYIIFTDDFNWKTANIFIMICASSVGYKLEDARKDKHQCVEGSKTVEVTSLGHISEEV